MSNKSKQVKVSAQVDVYKTQKTIRLVNKNQKLQVRIAIDIDTFDVHTRTNKGTREIDFLHAAKMRGHSVTQMFERVASVVGCTFKQLQRGIGKKAFNKYKVYLQDTANIRTQQRANIEQRKQILFQKRRAQYDVEFAMQRQKQQTEQIIKKVSTQVQHINFICKHVRRLRKDAPVKVKNICNRILNLCNELVDFDISKKD